MPFEPIHFQPSPGDPKGVFPLRITLDTGAYANQSFQAVLRVCTNPNCACSIVVMACAPAVPAPSGSGGRPLRFEADVVERTVRPGDGAAPEACGLALALEAEMTCADWELFYGIFRTAKLRMMEEIDPDTIDITFPAGEIEQGLMIDYRQVFPWAEMFSCAVGPDRWLVADSYCLQPDCGCKEVGLALFNLGGELWTPPDAFDPSVFLFFDYQTGKARLEESSSGSPRPGVLISALRKAHPSLARSLRERHAQLRRIARRSLARSRSDSAARTGIPDMPPSVGRNDPCPCGSGKKFKKCCG